MDQTNVLQFPALRHEGEAMNFSCTTVDCRVMVFSGVPHSSLMIKGKYFSVCPACSRPATRPIPGDTSST